jgi:SNF2 family DNA or RNA helicase
MDLELDDILFSHYYDELDSQDIEQTINKDDAEFLKAMDLNVNENIGQFIGINKDDGKDEDSDDDMLDAKGNYIVQHEHIEIKPIEELTGIEKLFAKAYGHLSEFQRDILAECIKKSAKSNGGGLSLPMGSGKTLISLTLALYLAKETKSNAIIEKKTKNKVKGPDGKEKTLTLKMKVEKEVIDPILIVCGKSLIASWETEIKKFFEDQLVYDVVHKGKMGKKIFKWKLRDRKENDVQIILTTADNLAIFYKENEIKNQYIKRTTINHGMTVINHYQASKQTLGKHKYGGGAFYANTFSILIIDEGQKYTNMETDRCQSLCSIHAKHRWVLSGTLFDEPVTRRILGYHMMIGYTDVPDNIPDMEKLVNGAFKGLNHTLVHRKRNLMFIPPTVNQFTITHDLLPEEAKIYTGMKNVLTRVKEKAKAAVQEGDIGDVRKFSSYKLAMIMYLRQVLICSMLPIASMAIDTFDFKKQNELSRIVMEEIDKLGIQYYLDDINSVRSSRIIKIVESMNKHKDERVVMFSGFKSAVDIIEHYLPQDRPILRMVASMSMDARGKLIKDFEKTKNGILLLTYQLGAEGLNLQFASTVMLTDFWWNAAKTQQAVARIFRYGQKSKEINVYMFVANTGIEKIILQKQNAKLQMLEELKTGARKSKIPIIKTDKIIEMIEMEDNKSLIQKIYEEF